MTKRVTSRKKRLLLSEVVTRYLRDVEVTKTDYTLVSYRQHINVLVRLLLDVCQVQYLDEVEVDHLRRSIQHLSLEKFDPSSRHGRACANGSSLAASTLRGYVRIWKAFFSWCLQEGLIEDNPADARFKAPKQVKKVKPAFTAEHLDKILAVFDTSRSIGFRNYTILVLLLDTGMRLSEIAGLQFQNVHETYVKVLGKGRKEREIGIHPETGKLLWKYVNQYRLPHDDSVTTFFLTRTGTNSTIGLVKTIIAEVQKKTGLVDIQLSAHIFRHTFAKMYLESGGDLFKLSREMGHSDVQITKIYLEDFGSTEARKDHTSHSPVAHLNLKKQHGKKKK